MPEAAQVEEDEEGLPLVLRGKRRLKVTSIEDRWRIDDEWWRSEPVSRIYYAVMLASGQKIVLYKDLIKNTWQRQTI